MVHFFLWFVYFDFNNGIEFGVRIRVYLNKINK